MKKLQLYSNCLEKLDIENLTCMEGYEVIKHQIGGGLPEEMDNQGRTLVVIYNPKEMLKLWDLIKEIKNRNEAVAVLLILDKEDFSVAYEACRYPFVHLLLQSENEEGWNRCVNICLEHIQYMEQVQKDKAQLEEYEFQKHHKIRERLLTNILDKPKQVEFLLPEINLRYGTYFGEGWYQVLIIQIDKAEASSPSTHFIKEVTLKTLRALTFTKEIVIGFREPFGMVGILHFSKDADLSNRKRDFERLNNSIAQLQEKYGEFRVTLAVGGEVHSISQILDSMEEADLAKEYRITTGKQVLYAWEIENLKQDMENYLPERKRKELIRHITMGDVRHVNSWFLDFHQNIKPHFMNYPPAFLYLCRYLYQDIAEHEKISKLQAFSEWKFFSLQHMFDVQERIQELEILILEICHMMAEGMQEEQEVAVKAIAYMKVHFRDPINLEFIAEKCGLSTSYFSRKFKEQTGTNYIDVLTDIRIREAQKLLGTTDMSIMEIIDEVGYCDDKHFRKLFSKVTGMKPMEYRKKIRKDKNFQ
jgi:AraC-like DNA-binding protein